MPHRIRHQRLPRLLFCRQCILPGDLAGSTCLAEVVRIRRAVDLDLVEEAMVREALDSNLLVEGHSNHLGLELGGRC